MVEYQKYSLEELRLSDYMANREPLTIVINKDLKRSFPSPSVRSKVEYQTWRYEEDGNRPKSRLNGVDADFDVKRRKIDLDSPFISGVTPNIPSVPRSLVKPPRSQVRGRKMVKDIAGGGRMLEQGKIEASEKTAVNNVIVKEEPGIVVTETAGTLLKTNVLIQGNADKIWKPAANWNEDGPDARVCRWCPSGTLREFYKCLGGCGEAFHLSRGKSFKDEQVTMRPFSRNCSSCQKKQQASHTGVKQEFGRSRVKASHGDEAENFLLSMNADSAGDVAINIESDRFGELNKMKNYDLEINRTQIMLDHFTALQQSNGEEEVLDDSSMLSDELGAQFDVGDQVIVKCCSRDKMTKPFFVMS